MNPMHATKQELVDLAFAMALRLEQMSDKAKAEDRTGLMAAAAVAANHANCLLDALRRLPLEGEA